jgi:uracil DNA glycosylase
MPPKKKQKSLVLDSILKDVPEAWAESLRPALEEAAIEAFLGECRSALPPPEMLLQALKPTAPADVKTVVFGLAPYPRAESACGIALFDAALTSWEDSKFGKVVSMRNMVKAALCCQFGLPQSADIAACRKMLRDKKIVDPKSLFVSWLSQGVLLLNAALTIDLDGKDHTLHTEKWRPVVSRIIELILRAKSDSGEAVVFCFWGDKAKKLRPILTALQKQYPKAQVHINEHANPAAQGDLFSISPKNPFKEINRMLGSAKIDWMPTAVAGAQVKRISSFIDTTLEEHAALMARLQEGGHADDVALQPIRLPDQVLPWKNAINPLIDVVKDIEEVRKKERAEKLILTLYSVCD